MVKHVPVPSLGFTRVRPADVIFQDTSKPAPAPPAARPNVKISAYLPGELLADMDAYRTAMLRERGVSLDRSRVLRELVRCALDSRELLARLLAPEVTP